MQNIVGHAQVTVTLGNTTDRWLIVGNYWEIVSHHRTKDEAESDLKLIGNDGPDGLAETPWSVLSVIAPGAHTSGTLLVPLVSDNPKDNTPPDWLPEFNDPGELARDVSLAANASIAEDKRLSQWEQMFVLDIMDRGLLSDPKKMNHRQAGVIKRISDKLR